MERKEKGRIRNVLQVLGRASCSHRERWKKSQFGGMIIHEFLCGQVETKTSLGYPSRDTLQIYVSRVQREV